MLFPGEPSANPLKERKWRIILFTLLSLKRHKNMFAAGHGSKLGGPILSRCSKAQLSSFLTEFVYAKVKFAFPFPFGRREVDGLRLLRGVDGAGPLADLAAFGNEAPCAVSAVDHCELLYVRFHRLV